MLGKAMNRTRLPVGLRKHIRHQKEKMRRQANTQAEAEEKIREFLRGAIHDYYKVK